MSEELKARGRSKYQILLLLVNIALFGTAFVLFEDDGGFYRNYWGYQLKFYAFVMAATFLNCIYLAISSSIRNPQSLLAMWLRRRRLEEEVKIKELQGKN